jgi:hypothetical protein
LEAALARIGELEARLAAFERPAKTPDNSSLPPSRGQKLDRRTGDKPPRKSLPGFGRTLHPNPDRVWECPENGGMTTQRVRSVGSIADRGNGDAMGVAVDCDRG